MSSHWTESSSWFMQLSNRYKTVVFYCHRYFYSVYLMELILWYQQAVAIDCCCSILLKCTHNLWIIGSFYYRATTRTEGKLSRRSVQAIWDSCFSWFYLLLPCSRFYKATHWTEQQLTRGLLLKFETAVSAGETQNLARKWSRRLNLWKIAIFILPLQLIMRWVSTHRVGGLDISELYWENCFSLCPGHF